MGFIQGPTYSGISIGESGAKCDTAFGNTTSINCVCRRGIYNLNEPYFGARRSSSSQYLFTGSTDYTAASANNVTGGQLAIGSFNNTAARFDGTIGEVMVGQRAGQMPS